MSFNLPREIIKWIQGLDLSYSVVDYKRDLNDGFLVAEIFSRYFPEKMTQDDIDRKRYMPLSMHMFDHSQKIERRKNNWHLLDLFFIRNNQLGNDMPFTKKDINQIPDNNFEQLRTFLCKLYTFLTSKKITKPPLASLIQTEKGFVSTGQTQQMEGHGASYILTEKGLEKLDNKDGKEEGKQNSELKINETGQSKDGYPVGTSLQSKKTAFLRNYSKPIGQAQEASALQIDVKNIAVRPVQMPVAKLKEKKDFLGPQKQTLSDSFRKSGQMDMHQTGQYTEPQKKKDKKLIKKLKKSWEKDCSAKYMQNKEKFDQWFDEAMNAANDPTVEKEEYNKGKGFLESKWQQIKDKIIQKATEKGYNLTEQEIFDKLKNKVNEMTTEENVDSAIDKSLKFIKKAENKIDQAIPEEEIEEFYEESQNSYEPVR